MPSISEDDIRRVREASDLVAIAGERMVLRQRGRDFWGCCPFHNEKTPSFKIDPTTQLWHCFGCGEGGDVFSFVMKIDDLEFADAVRELARRAGIEISETPGERLSRGKKARLKEVCREAASFYHTRLMRGSGSQFDAARSYLSGRNLGGDIPKRWNLGYAPGQQTLVNHLRSLGFTSQELIDANVALPSKRGGSLRDRFFDRIMFPIRDVDGETIAFGGRVVGKGEPKYLNSQETPIFHKSEVLFGLDMAKAAMASSGLAIVVEGYTDVIVLHEAGVKNAVATLGTALTVRHIRALSRHAKKRIVYLFDGDEAGQRAADRAARFMDESMLPEAGRSRVELCAVTLPDNLDPADFVQQRGAAALKDLIDQAIPLLRYAIDRSFARYNLSDFSDRSRALPEVLGLLAPIKKSVLAQEYVGYIADRLRVDSQEVARRLAAMPVPRISQGGDDETSSPMPTIQPVSLSPQERERLRIEREFLSLCARIPQIGLDYAAILAQTQWHSNTHASIASALLTYLSDNPQADAGDVVRGVEEACPGSASTLTYASVYDEVDSSVLARFLAEELAIRDIEEAILALNAQLKDPSVLSDDDYETIYATTVGMQKDLISLRRSHISLENGGEG